MSAALRSGLWLRPPPPGRSIAHSFLGRAHQIRFGVSMRTPRSLRLLRRERRVFAPTCRVLGCVAAEPVSLRHELLDARNPMIRQSGDHDSGWGICVYKRGQGEDPVCKRFPEAAFSDEGFKEATEMRGRIFNVHVRRATMGGLVMENTHPFCLGPYSFGHNGTVLHFPRLLELGVPEPK